PYDGMNMWVLSATIDGAALDVNDEIAALDGEDCVGVATVSGTVSYQNPVVIHCSGDDGSGNGFTAGAAISFKTWDADRQEESATISSDYFSISTGDPISPPAFTTLMDYGVELTGLSKVTQTIPLVTGWNSFSAYAIPENSTMLNFVQPLIDAGALVKVRDENGNMVMFTNSVWTDNIEDVEPGKSYQIKVNANINLVVEGRPVEPPLTLPLTDGWNYIGYPFATPLDAMGVVQPLIDAGVLVKMYDKHGNGVVPYMGVWSNYIGALEQGEGYRVQVNANASLTLSEALPAPDGVQPDAIQHVQSDAAATHYTLPWRGKPYQCMNIWVAGVNGVALSPGDEIAVFDGDMCVGVGVVEAPISEQNFLIIHAAMDDGDANGFTPGAPITLKIWLAAEQREITDITNDYV
ncbi:MAG: hypothetical protein GY859_37345, partial [Desulfobacterales bacterium]|nr:hypothetical protein [Desulfobacterales bacterium]